MEAEGEELDWGLEDDPNDDPCLYSKISERSLIKTKDFAGHSSDDIEDRQKKVIEEILELLGLDEDDAITALKHYNWNSEKLQEQWFNNEAKTREECGLTPKKYLVSRNMDKQDVCYIGYSKLNKDSSDSLNCGHYFCSECWNDYFKCKLTGGYHGVFSTCPYYECPLTVTHSTWRKHLAGKDKQKYINYHCKSYTDDNKNIKWCPAPGCKYCIENISYSFSEVTCECGNSFCFKGNQDSHRPCNCDLATKWQMKNKSESENITWMIANTKNCPQCQRPIEKNQGCNHMTCNMCKHEFGWMCMGSWTDHGSGTGGYYKCNKYEELKNDKNALTKLEEKREQAKHELKKYMFFYERYTNHMKAGEHAKEMEPKIKILVEKLNNDKNYPIAELTFLEEALVEVIKCRKVLKWTYAYGFYLVDEKEKNLFEHQQQLLEENCDKLHELLERDFEPFLNEEELDKKPFYHYKSDLVSGYKATKQFYLNLLEGLENEDMLAST